MTDKVKIICIVGTGKSGSTLLGKLLGQVEGFEDVGELINIDRQFARAEKCGCGVSVRECGLWSTTVASALGGIEGLDKRRWRRLKTRYLPVLALPGGADWARRYFHQLAHLQRALRDASGKEVIVDGSKSVFYSAVLNLFPDLDVYTLHLVRDVRASEGSMFRLKTEGSSKFSARSTWWNSVRWMLINRVAEWAARRVGSCYRRVRYEDLIAAPEQTLRGILEFAGEDADKVSFISGRVAHLRKTHSIAGSDVRLKQGAIALRPDERWREGLPERNLAVVDGLTRRFRRRYGY
jgi:hypothetical protein